MLSAGILATSLVENAATWAVVYLVLNFSKSIILIYLNFPHSAGTPCPLRIRKSRARVQLHKFAR
jgi:hypothetical protein